jgi:DNA-binding NtrC family response regulator
MDKGKEENSKRIRVLLVDDEVGYVNVLSKRMKKRDMDVTPAYSGLEAIQKLRKAEFHVAVLDLKMEDLDGIEVLKMFKKIDPSMEVIMLTGHGSEQAARDAISIGAFDYITKPCDLEELIEKIRVASKRKGGNRGG